MKQFPGRAVWRVDTPDLPPGQYLVIAFGEGVILAGRKSLGRLLLMRWNTVRSREKTPFKSSTRGRVSTST